ncbi:MAG: hypothetical protein COA73_18875 [Candidatus Hydrogenedentota bacterium]|nr:MAG: hypothetical protein COA73_18875 [Candidatus Hydrogenedentota bacterium]
MSTWTNDRDDNDEPFYISKSTDYGATWISEPFDINMQGFESFRYANIATDKKGNWYIAFVGFPVLSNHPVILVTTSNDDGDSWSQPSVIFNSITNRRELFSSLNVGPDGKCVISIFNDWSQWVCDTDDLGKNWSEPRLVASRESGVAKKRNWFAGKITVDAGEHWVVPAQSDVRVRDSETGNLVRYENISSFHSIDNGDSWVEIEHFTEPGWVCSIPSIATDSNGNWLIAWIASRLEDRYTALFFAKSTNDGVTWSEPEIIGGNENYEYFQFPIMHTDGGGNWFLFFYTDAGAEYIYSSNVGVDWSGQIVLDEYVHEFDIADNGMGKWLYVGSEYWSYDADLHVARFHVFPYQDIEPCEDEERIIEQYEGFVEEFSVSDDMDSDGLPDRASLALIAAASCQYQTSNGAATNVAYKINRDQFELESFAFEYSDYDAIIPALMSMSTAMQQYLISTIELPFEFDYPVVNCTSPDDCTPVAVDDDKANSSLRNSNVVICQNCESLSGYGDPDWDNTNNFSEYSNVISQGGSLDDFTNAALDSRSDGSETSSSSSSGFPCLIATMYGSNLGDGGLVPIREFRDTFLMSNSIGIGISDIYYRLSPAASKYYLSNPALASVSNSTARFARSYSVWFSCGVFFGLLGCFALRSRRKQGHVERDHTRRFSSR